MRFEILSVPLRDSRFSDCRCLPSAAHSQRTVALIASSRPARLRPSCRERTRPACTQWRQIISPVPQTHAVLPRKPPEATSVASEIANQVRYINSIVLDSSFSRIGLASKRFTKRQQCVVPLVGSKEQSPLLVNLINR